MTMHTVLSATSASVGSAKVATPWKTSFFVANIPASLQRQFENYSTLNFGFAGTGFVGKAVWIQLTQSRAAAARVLEAVVRALGNGELAFNGRT